MYYDIVEYFYYYKSKGKFLRIFKINRDNKNVIKIWIDVMYCKGM